MSVPPSAATDATDLDSTAELPALDVAAYEAHSRDSSRTDAWRGPIMVAAAPDATAPGPHRSRLEQDLSDLSTNLRQLEERLAVKGERLSALERELDAVREARRTAEQRADAISRELTESRSSLGAARAQIGELRQVLEVRETETRDAALRGHRLAADILQRDQALAAAQLQLDELRCQSAAHVEVLRAAEGRRGVQEMLVRGLDGELRERDTELATANRDINARGERITQLSAQLTVAHQRLQALETEVGSLATELAKKTEQINVVTGANTELRTRLQELSSVDAAHLERIRAVETDASAHAQAHSEALQSAVKLQRELEEAQANSKHRVSALETELATIRLQLSERTLALQRVELEHVSAVQKKDVQHATELHKLAADHASDLHALRTEQASRLEQAQAAHASALESLQADHARALQSLDAEHAGVRESARAARDGLLAEHARALEALQAEHASTLARFEADHAERLALLNASESEVRRLRELVTGLEGAQRLLREDLRATADRAGSIEANMCAADETIERLTVELRVKTARIEELGEQCEELRTTLSSARQSLEEREALIRRLETEAAHSSALLDNIQHNMRALDAPQSGSEFAPEGCARLLVRTESDGGGEVVHVLGRRTSIGRTPDNDVQLDTKFVSRHHAMIIAGPVHTIIEDLNSTNGLLVNGRKVVRQMLKDGDTLSVGKTQFRFTVRQSPMTERRTQ